MTKTYYTKWIISEYKKSFLWKLNNINPDSSRLLKDSQNRQGTFRGDKVGLWDKYRVPTLKSIKENKVIVKKIRYPESITRLQYNDTKGRINKGRIWFTYIVKETNLEVHIYNKVQFELCPEEFEENFNDPYQIITDLGKDYFYNVKELDNVNAGRASDLNLSFIVDYETGKWKHGNFPVNWSKVKSNLKVILESFVNSIKYTSVCLSYGNKDINPFGCYQAFSMDFIVDERSNTWLLECNTRPWIGSGIYWKKFDPKWQHLNNKWVYLESLLNIVIDPYYPPKNPSKVKKHWKKIVSVSKKKFQTPTMYYKTIAPVEGIHQKTDLGKNLVSILNKRGWSMFPWKKYLNKPDFVWQGITPLLKYILEDKKYDRSKIIKAYPELLKANIINRVFPLVVYLGNKSMLIKVLKDKHPNEWHNIIPWSF